MAGGASLSLGQRQDVVAIRTVSLQVFLRLRLAVSVQEVLGVALARLALDVAVPLSTRVPAPVREAVVTNTRLHWIANAILAASRRRVALGPAARLRIEDLAVRVVLALCAYVVRLISQVSLTSRRDGALLKAAA